jgi:drug/metabolite transporter (DMT)-like permease
VNAGLAPTACAMVLAGATALAVATGIWYVSLNAFLNYFNNWVLSPEPKGLGFSMPIFYSTWHMVASSIGCAIILRLRGLPPPSLDELKSCWKGVLPLALCTSVNIACNNASLALVSLFVNQVIKGTTPLITVPASMVLEKKRYPWYVIASVVVLVGGAVLSLDWSGGGDTPNQLLGIMLIVIAAFATAIKPVCAAVMMSGESKMSPVRLVFYDTLLSLPIMIAATLIFPGETARAVTYLRAKPGTAAFVICLGSLAAFSYNLSIYFFTKMASALTLAVVGQACKIALMASAAIVAHVTNPLQWTGVGVVCLGVIVYSYSLRLMKQKQAEIAAAAPGAADAPKETTPLSGAKK